MDGLFILGGIILIGVVGKLLFDRTHVPESLYLILAGILLGPVFGWIDPGFFRDNTSFFTTIALVIVLLDSGLKLDAYRTLKNSPSAIAYALVSIILTTALTAVALVYGFGWQAFHAIFLGIIVSGTTTVTIANLIGKLTKDRKTVKTDTQTILFIESVVSDIIVIGTGAVLLGLAQTGTLSGQNVFVLVFNTFLVSILIGALLGVLWVFTYAYRLQGSKLSYIVTLGIAFLIYAAAEFIGLNGALTVAVFSLVFGNHATIVDTFRVRTKLFRKLDRDITTMKKTDVEITFLITAFFFVLLGIIFDISALWSVTIVGITVAVLALKLLARYVTCFMLERSNESFRKARTAHTTFMSCGIASVLVAFLAIDANLAIPFLKEIVLLVVIATTVVAILGTTAQEWLTAQAKEE